MRPCALGSRQVWETDACALRLMAGSTARSTKDLGVVFDWGVGVGGCPWNSRAWLGAQP